LQEAYADWLASKHWDYFLTVTSRTQRTNAKLFLDRVWSKLHYDHGATKAFLVAEPHQATGNLHVHGICADNPHGSRLDLPWVVYNTMFRTFGRSKIDLVRSHEDVSAYCSKYVTKTRGQDHYEFYGTKTAWKY